MDLITREISRFIGALNLLLEGGRQRFDHDAVRVSPLEAEPDGPGTTPLALRHPYSKAEHSPALSLAAGGGPGTAPLPRTDPGGHGWMHVPALGWGLAAGAAAAPAAAATPLAGGAWPVPPEPAPPGSVHVVIKQQNTLGDVDILLHGGFAVPFAPPALFDAALEAALTTAQGLTLTDLTAPAARFDAVKAGALELAEAALAAEPAPGPGEAHLVEGATGLYLNGAPIDELPEHVPADPAEAQIHTGANTLVNAAAITVNWIDAPVYAVMGDTLRLDVISQVNLLHESLHAPAPGAYTPAALVNAAGFVSTGVAGPVIAAAADGPANLHITRLDGDLAVFNWLEQYNFVRDHDMVSLTLAAGESHFLLGGNTAVNLAELFEHGFGYDLIVIGGDMVQLSMITQINVLLDATVIAGAEATVIWGGNTLWNEAVIAAPGQTHGGALPDPYAEAGATLGAGGRDLPAGLLEDPAFAGLETLRILHVEGDLIVFNHIHQVNVLGDADQFAIFAGDAAGDWVALAAGGNTLLNTAVITELGGPSLIHAGGTHYSDAMLHQAEFVASDAPDPFQPDPFPLIGEAVAFLAEGMLAAEADAAPQPLHSGAPPPASDPDILQTMLA